MKIYNISAKANQESLLLSADDFYRVVLELSNSADHIYSEASKVLSSEDTVPYKLALGLVDPLGYKTVDQFLEVNSP